MGVALHKDKDTTPIASADVRSRVAAIRTKVFELVRQLHEASADCDVSELDKAGDSSVEVGPLEALPRVIDALLAAVKAGELDAQLAAAAPEQQGVQAAGGRIEGRLTVAKLTNMGRPASEGRPPTYSAGMDGMYEFVAVVRLPNGL